jgi:hypothetical protein
MTDHRETHLDAICHECRNAVVGTRLHIELAMRAAKRKDLDSVVISLLNADGCCKRIELALAPPCLEKNANGS